MSFQWSHVVVYPHVNVRDATREGVAGDTEGTAQQCSGARSDMVAGTRPWERREGGKGF